MVGLGVCFVVDGFGVGLAANCKIFEHIRFKVRRLQTNRVYNS